MPEPFTFVRSKSASPKPHSRVQASACAANASLSSMRSMSLISRPARCRAAAVAGTGPMPIVRGGTPARPQLTMRTSGLRPSSSAFARVVTIVAAAPSFWPDALPAVTVEFSSILARSALSLPSDSRDAPGRMCSSSVICCSGCLRVAGIVIGTISSANTPLSVAAAARRCDSTARRSCSSRPIEYSARRFSAVSIMPPGTG